MLLAITRASMYVDGELAVVHNSSLLSVHACGAALMPPLPSPPPFLLPELRPLSCTGASPHGGLSLTLIEALSTLLLAGQRDEFERAVAGLVGSVALFDRDVRANVFEMTIRVMGGLLSAHLAIMVRSPSTWAAPLSGPLLHPVSVYVAPFSMPNTPLVPSFAALARPRHVGKLLPPAVRRL